jgi:hypothetical protein
MSEQEEKIIWHKWPEVKPQYLNVDWLLVTVDTFEITYTRAARWQIDDWYDEDGEVVNNIVAWAEMPVGWVEK